MLAFDQLCLHKSQVVAPATHTCVVQPSALALTNFLEHLQEREAPAPAATAAAAALPAAAAPAVAGGVVAEGEGGVRLVTAVGTEQPVEDFNILLQHEQRDRAFSSMQVSSR